MQLKDKKKHLCLYECIQLRLFKMNVGGEAKEKLQCVSQRCLANKIEALWL